MGIIKDKKIKIVQQDERSRARDPDSLVAALTDADPTARRWAARDLADFPAMASALAERLTLEPEASVREALLLSLTQIGNRVAVEGLLAGLRSDDAALRNEASEALKDLPDAVAPLMSDVLTDPDPDVRIFAVNVLESLRHPDVEQWLIQVISTDTHVNVCATAVDLLGEVGTTAAVSALQSLKARFPEEPYIHFAIDLALKRIHED